MQRFSRVVISLVAFSVVGLNVGATRVAPFDSVNRSSIALIGAKSPAMSVDASATAPYGPSLAARAPRDSPNWGSHPPVTYGGGRVMGTTAAGTTIHPVFWAPLGYDYQTGFQTGVDEFVADVAASSGSLQTVFGVATQYYQVSNGSFQYISPKVQAGAELDATDPYPTGVGCTPDVGIGFTACVTTAEIAAELRALVTSQGLPVGFGDLYTIFFPPGVETCFGSANTAQGGSCSSATSGSAYCGYHSSTPVGSTDLVFSVIPAANYCGSTPTAPTSGTVAAHEIANLVAHEAVESMTDPVSKGWLDGGHHEIADMCTGDVVTQTFGPGTWSVQEVFSDADYAANPQTGGCTNSLSTPLLTPYPFITTANLPLAAVAAKYNATLGVIGGQGPLTWTVVSGKLPPGLTLSASGEITGIPTTPRRYHATFVVVDARGDASPPTVFTLVVVRPTTPELRIGSVTLTARNSEIPVRLRCVVARCAGSVQLILQRSVLASSEVLASANVTISMNASATVYLRLTAAGTRELTRVKRAPIIAILRTHVRHGTSISQRVLLYS